MVETANKERVVLAYSGGLDTSVMVKWLQVEKNLDVVAICCNVGQESQDLNWVKQKALDMGAIAAESVDMRNEYAEQVLTKAVAANGLYEGTYPLLSALSRPMISAYMVEAAHQYGATYIAHGCTGKGNDQVRFETSIHAIDPSLNVIAPVREWDLLTREQEMEWAAAHDVPVPTTAAKPYSIDDNLFGRAIECGVLENAWNEPPADIWTMTVSPEEAPDTPTEVVIGFEAGVPVSLDGKKMSMLDLIVKLNKIAGANAYGRIDMIEDRVIGIKSRECYECPASLALINAHKALESMCLDHDTLHYKASVDQKWATLIYDGLWFSPLKNSLDAFIASTQQYVTGEVRAKFYKGTFVVTGRKSDYSLYQEGLATYGDGDLFDRSKSAGWISLHSLPTQTWSKQQGPKHVQSLSEHEVKQFQIGNTATPVPQVPTEKAKVHVVCA
ncbi:MULTISPECIES: argininosuccinate synthase [Atopobiaceae]|uniref:Argininosuccinate synthase n=1 Tax=Parafannyhessea umbonata TaxID=604330 RepID=A0A1H6IL51_9ACTN|nr:MULTISPECIES: argininosuccinate synthase [Atopobiaceae]SEH47678.1 argininosuccinate synthase [Parafannyhessea umbonata]SJZ68869.1 argininosuccinate synthase [Olsenella sp. KH1P3]